MPRRMGPHEYIDKSKRRPYLCGICGLDITDPIHQPDLPGIKAAPVTREEDELEAWEPDPEPDPDQASLFTFEEMRRSTAA